MHWIAAALLMFGSSVILYLVVRRASLAKASPTFNNLAIFLVPLPIFEVIGWLTHASYYITLQQAIIVIVSAIVFSYAANAVSLMSIELAPNPGYSLIISKSYVVLTTFLAVPLFGAQLSWHALLAVGLIIACSTLIFIDRQPLKHVRNSAWLWLALAALVGWAGLSLTAKYLFQQGMPAITFLTYLCLVANLCILAEMRLKRRSVRRTIAEHPGMFLVIGLMSASFNFFNFDAVSLAPNVGYVNAVNAASIGAVTVFAVWFFKDDFSVRKLIGVLGIIGGLLLLFLG